MGCAVACVTVKDVVGFSSPVVTDTGFPPGAAFAAIMICAVAEVALVTVTGPGAFAAAPPTEIPGPKFACVAPCAKFV